MSSKAIKISIVLLCLLALAVPSPAKSQAVETPPAERVCFHRSQPGKPSYWRDRIGQRQAE